jgi:hypothetical protein
VISAAEKFPQSIAHDSLVLALHIGRDRLRLLELAERSDRHAADLRERGEWIRAGEEIRHAVLYRAMLREVA